MIIPLRQQLEEQISKACQTLELPLSIAHVVVSERPELSQFQCNGALSGAKGLGVSPRSLAEKISDLVQTNLKWAKLEVADPGFINISIADEYLADFANQIARDPRLGTSPTKNPRKVSLDFGGPNTAKPLHVGHLRSAIIGDCLQRLGRYVGHQVTSDIHIGDWGTNMGIVICAIRREQPELSYFQENATQFPAESPVSLSDLERLYPAESTRCKEDPQAMAEAQAATRELQAGRLGYLVLWQQFSQISAASIRQTYDLLGIRFDLWKGESSVNDRIPALLERFQASGLAVRSEGALIVPLPTPPPLLLQKTDGAYLYATTDLATLEERIEAGMEILHYVADKRQDLHFRQFFAVGRLSKIVPEQTELYFHGFGTVNGPDGKPFKTRDGGVMRLEELINLLEECATKRLLELEIGKEYTKDEQQQIIQRVTMAALKFSDLVNNKHSDYSFDIDRFTSFEGKTGPYLLYTAVRASSILRSSGREDGSIYRITQITDFDRPLVLKLIGLSDVIDRAWNESAPHILCEYAFEVAQEFNRFYQLCNILREPDIQQRESWLGVTNLSVQTLVVVTRLLGIEIPDRM